MYSLSQLRRGFDSPNLFFRELNRLYHRRFNRRRYNTDGVDIFEEDWDTLVVLDACRYDMFSEYNTLPGRLEARRSRGSSTTEFLFGNFADRTLHDTVYVTANPQYHRHREALGSELHAVVDIWREDGWDAEEGTVLSETVTEYAQQAAERYPNKRLIVHYMQPHYPFVGSDTEFDKGQLDGRRTDRRNVWNQLMQGELSVDRATIWELYVENLEHALPHVETLVCALDGKTVVTADHGNVVGERAFPFPVREWGHPRGLYFNELVTVPWLVYEDGPRREVVAEVPTATTDDADEDVVTERLEHLGYAE